MENYEYQLVKNKINQINSRYQEYNSYLESNATHYPQLLTVLTFDYHFFRDNNYIINIPYFLSFYTEIDSLEKTFDLNELFSKRYALLFDNCSDCEDFYRKTNIKNDFSITEETYKLYMPLFLYRMILFYWLKFEESYKIEDDKIIINIKSLKTDKSFDEITNLFNVFGYKLENISETDTAIFSLKEIKTEVSGYRSLFFRYKETTKTTYFYFGECCRIKIDNITIEEETMHHDLINAKVQFFDEYYRILHIFDYENCRKIYLLPMWNDEVPEPSHEYIIVPKINIQIKPDDYYSLKIELCENYISNLIQI